MIMSRVYGSTRGLGGVVVGICVFVVVGMGAARGDEGDAAREPFEAPRTEAELRWLMDQAEAQRFRLIEGAEDPPRGRGQRGFVWPQDVAPELERIQRDLGGSAVEQFPSLRGEPRGAKPPAAGAREAGVQEAPPWGGPPAAEQDRRKVEALREAASQLDVTANRLEQLELYDSADALREQAQRLRVDARGMVEGPQAARPLGFTPEAEGQGSGTRPLRLRSFREERREPTAPRLEPTPAEPDE
jgi:hypothetical protein